MHGDKPSARTALAIAFLVLLASFACPSQAQDVPLTIRVLQGHTSRPVSGTQIYLFTNGHPGPVAPSTNAAGETTVSLPDSGTLHLITESQWIPCYEREDWIETKSISLHTIASTGLLLPNRCGTTNATSQPHLLILFVRPLRWWERLRD